MAYPDSFPNIQYGTGGDISAIAEVRRHINEPVARDCSDSQIQEWLDAGAAETARLTKLLEGGTAYITLATGTKTYAYPAALYSAPQDISIEIETLFYCAAATGTPQTAQGGYALMKVDLCTIGNLPNSTPGKPSYWADFSYDNNNRTLYIYPAPSLSENGHVIEILFYKAAQYLKAADSSTTHYLPEYLRENVIWYAVAEAHRSKGLYAIAEAYEAMFRNVCMFHRMDKHPKTVDSTDKTKIPDYTQYQ